MPTTPGTPVSPTEPTETEPESPAEPSNPGTEETEPSEPTEPDVPSQTMTYLEYYALSADEQQAFINSFPSIEDFFAWHTAAKKAYENERTPIDQLGKP